MHVHLHCYRYKHNERATNSVAPPVDYNCAVDLLRQLLREILFMVAQSSHFFYPVCFCLEQPANSFGKFLFWHRVESTGGVAGAGYF